MIEIEIAADFPQRINANYYVTLLVAHGYSNRSQLGSSVTVTVYGHGDREVVRGLINQSFGTVRNEEFFGSD